MAFIFSTTCRHRRAILRLRFHELGMFFFLLSWVLYLPMSLCMLYNALSLSVGYFYSKNSQKTPISSHIRSFVKSKHALYTNTWRDTELLSWQCCMQYLIIFDHLCIDHLQYRGLCHIKFEHICMILWFVPMVGYIRAHQEITPIRPSWAA